MKNLANHVKSSLRKLNSQSSLRKFSSWSIQGLGTEHTKATTPFGGLGSPSLKHEMESINLVRPSKHETEIITLTNGIRIVSEIGGIPN